MAAARDGSCPVQLDDLKAARGAVLALDPNFNIRVMRSKMMPLTPSTLIAKRERFLTCSTLECRNSATPRLAASKLPETLHRSPRDSARKS